LAEEDEQRLKELANGNVAVALFNPRATESEELGLISSRTSHGPAELPSSVRGLG